MAGEIIIHFFILPLLTDASITPGELPDVALSGDGQCQGRSRQAVPGAVDGGWVAGQGGDEACPRRQGGGHWAVDSLR